MTTNLKTVIFLLSAFMTAKAADCTSPSAPEGTLRWLTSPSPSIYFCNGASWINTDKGTTNAGGACAASQIGRVEYISTGTLSTTTYRFCDGTNWRNMKGVSLGTCSNAGTTNYSAGTNKYTFCAMTTLYDMSSGLSCTVTLTSAGATNTWTVPTTWNNSANTIQVIGAGGSGRNGTTGAGGSGMGGGGGGGYAKVANLTLTPSTNVSYRTGTGGGGPNTGGQSYFCNSTSNCTGMSGTAVVASAFGGTTATAITGATGAPLSVGTINAVGTIKYGGGDGGDGNGVKGGGGGGAGGAAAAGASSTGQSGGAGNGGAGGAGATTPSAAGGADAVGGSGGGGAGGNNNGNGGAGGNYGGGGAGGGKGGTAGTGAGGAVIINWTSMTSSCTP